MIPGFQLSNRGWKILIQLVIIVQEKKTFNKI